MPDPIRLVEIENVAAVLRCHKGSPLTLTVPYILPIYGDCHDRIARGCGLHLDMWRYLFEVLIHPKFPEATFWRDTHQAHELAPGERAFRPKLHRTAREGQKCCWSIQVFSGGTHVVIEYRLRNTYGDPVLEKCSRSLERSHHVPRHSPCAVADNVASSGNRTYWRFCKSRITNKKEIVYSNHGKGFNKLCILNSL